MPRDIFADEPQGRDIFADNEPPKYTPQRWAGLTARNVLQGAAALPATLLDVPAEAYNLGADALQGKGKGFRFKEMNQNVSAMLDKAGLPRPETAGEQIGSTIAQSVAGAGTGMATGGALAGTSSPAAAAVGRTMQTMPGRQLASSVLGGGAAAGAQQAGAPWYVQGAAGLLGGMAPYVNPGRLVAGGPRTPQEQRVMDAGYRLPPATMEDPSLLSRLLGGWSGKIKSQQTASAHNQGVTNRIAARELGLPDDTALDDNVLAGVRRTAGQVAQTVRDALPNQIVDQEFVRDANALGQRNAALARDFPELVRNEGIADLSTNFANKTAFSTEAAQQAVQTLRADGTRNLQAIGDPQRHQLGLAQRQAANAIDNLIERNLDRMGQHQGMVGDVGFLADQFRAARTLLAKSYDIESAMNPATGSVDARKMARLADNRPMTGGTADIAYAGNAFPKSTQVPEKFGGVEPLSVLDLLAAGGTAATGAFSGHPLEGAGLGAVALSRPAARALTLSGPYQRALRNPGPVIAPQSAAQIMQLSPRIAALVSALQQ